MAFVQIVFGNVHVARGKRAESLLGSIPNRELAIVAFGSLVTVTAIGAFVFLVGGYIYQLAAAGFAFALSVIESHGST